MGQDSEIIYSEVWLFLPLFLTFLPFIIILLGSCESNVLYFMYTVKESIVIPGCLVMGCEVSVGGLVVTSIV